MLGKNFRIAVMCLALVALWRAPELLAESAGDSFSVTLFEHVRIFNGKTGTLSAPTNVLVQANKIKRISTEPIPVDRSNNTNIIDGAGRRTLMPGLIDAHYHIVFEGIPQVEAMTADIGYIYQVPEEQNACHS